ncbi:MAG: IS1595 family transposase [Bacteroidetes bacterium]|nr:IS1595 family transposase [Bacteroidota bacterium]
MAKAQADLKRLSEEEARALLESIRWPEGPRCAHCSSEDVYPLTGKGCRPGLRHCRSCRRQSSVTVGTVMERSRVKCWQWVYVFAAMAASKKGISAHQLERELGVQYKTAFFMCHRARHAMKESFTTKLGGEGKTLVADEAFVGGRPRYPGRERTPKTPVVVLLERGGQARAVVTPDVTAWTLRKHLEGNGDLASRLMTDENAGYKMVGRKFKGGHQSVNHSAREFARGDANSSEAEAYFALLKRGLYGVFHHVSPERLHLYVQEFDWRWNRRKMSDTERALEGLKMAEGKRLYYRKPRQIEGGERSSTEATQT